MRPVTPGADENSPYGFPSRSYGCTSHPVERFLHPSNIKAKSSVGNRARVSCGDATETRPGPERRCTRAAIREMKRAPAKPGALFCVHFLTYWVSAGRPPG